MTENISTRQLVAVLLVALGTVLLAPLLLGGVGMMGYGPMGYGPMMGGQFDGTQVSGWTLLLAWVLRLLLLVAVVAGGYLLYRAVTGSGDEDRVLEELRLAYARGDLSDKEYERRRETLEEDR